jgi:type I restriction enzyme S subunit
MNINSQLPPGWEWKRLGDICNIVNGSTPKTGIDEYWNGNIIWVTPTDLGKNTSKYVSNSERKITDEGYSSANTNLLPVKSIVLSTRAPIGYIAINNVEVCTNQGCKGIIPCPGVFTDYIYYYLKLNKDELDSLGSGSTFKELSTESLKSYMILLPPIAEQRRIAAIIDAKLAVIEKTKKAAEEQLAATVSLLDSYYKAYF